MRGPVRHRGQRKLFAHPGAVRWQVDFGALRPAGFAACGLREFNPIACAAVFGARECIYFSIDRKATGNFFRRLSPEPHRRRSDVLHAQAERVIEGRTLPPRENSSTPNTTATRSGSEPEIQGELACRRSLDSSLLALCQARFFHRGCSSGAAAPGNPTA